MDQEEIMQLLREAVHPGTTQGRRAQIQYLLQRAASQLPRAFGVHIVLDALYTVTIENHPEFLPTFFPAFAIMCGDRSKNTIEDSIVTTNVDWSLMN